MLIPRTIILTLKGKPNPNLTHRNLAEKKEKKKGGGVFVLHEQYTGFRHIPCLGIIKSIIK